MWLQRVYMCQNIKKYPHKQSIFVFTWDLEEQSIKDIVKADSWLTGIQGLTGNLSEPSARKHGTIFKLCQFWKQKCDEKGYLRNIPKVYAIDLTSIY